MQEVDGLDLRPESWQAMMRDNAMRLFKLDAAGDESRSSALAGDRSA